MPEGRLTSAQGGGVPAGPLNLPAPVAAMVFVQDEGSLFDAPIGIVWEYLLEGAAHDGVHKSTRNGKFEPLTHSSFVYSAERYLNGAWVPESIRISVFQPVAIASVFLEGPFEGSKMVYVYKPKGTKTQIDVYGDFRSPSIPPDQLEGMARAMLDTEYREDDPAIRRFASSK